MKDKPQRPTKAHNSAHDLSPIHFGYLIQAKGSQARRIASVAIVTLGILMAGLITGVAVPSSFAVESDIVILAGGDLRGEIEPCGCSNEGQMGGLPRRMTYLDQRTSENPDHTLLVDLGNNFPPPSPQGKLKIQMIQNLLQVFPPVAILPGPNELALGPGVLSPGLPWVLSNNINIGNSTTNLSSTDLSGRVSFHRHILTKKGKQTIAVFGYLSPTEIYQKSQGHFQLSGPTSALLANWRDQLKEASNPPAILLFRGPTKELETFTQAKLFQAIFVGNPNADELNQVVERKVSGQKLPQVPTKGQGFVRALLPTSPDSSPPMGKVDWLTDKYGDHLKSKSAFKKYNDEVKALFFARMDTIDRVKKESPYVGAETCAACHQKASQSWRPSRHAGAIKTLERVGKQFDPECLACHVAGLERGGYISADITGHLAGVQCENCHGPGRAHAAKADQKPAPLQPPGIKVGNKPAEATCRTCHMGSHSPKFSYKVYWEKVKH